MSHAQLLDNATTALAKMTDNNNGELLRASQLVATIFDLNVDYVIGLRAKKLQKIHEPVNPDLEPPSGIYMCHECGVDLATQEHLPNCAANT